MNRKYWCYFAMVQVLGLLGYFEAMYLLQDGLFWLFSLCLFLPGSLVFLPGMLYAAFQPSPAHVVETPVLPLYVATFVLNVLFFYVLLRVLARRRNARLT